MHRVLLSVYFPAPAVRPLTKNRLKNGYMIMTGMMIIQARAILRDSVGTAAITVPLTFSFAENQEALLSMLYKMYCRVYSSLCPESV